MKVFVTMMATKDSDHICRMDAYRIAKKCNFRRTPDGDVDEVKVLTHAEAVSRVVDHWAMFEHIRFDLNLVVAGDDGEHVAIVYQSPMKLKDGTETTVGSMEIFRVIGGRITEVWNCGYKQGVWA